MKNWGGGGELLVVWIPQKKIANNHENERALTHRSNPRIFLVFYRVILTENSSLLSSMNYDLEEIQWRYHTYK